MLVEHTHLHLQSVPPDRGEFLLLKVMVELGLTGGGLQFENGLSPEMNALFRDQFGRWQALRAGAVAALQEAGVENALVCVVGVKFQDDSLSLPLCEQLSKTCITGALENPEVPFTETGNRREIQRFKDRNADLLEAWSENQLFN
ncbi:hypothetical protein [Pseudophaeobacter sp.]|jgi:hypothetical protein|uniref:hypothetical protein n=1 Tax=Pseudophaeobacter sp. TaxID=1971739 RepID=UPI0021FCA2D8|nr:hypothetical protein [Pseudophaeobacter sp.]UWS80004.1 hypothetical protein N1037_02965 [Phaeobacter sp. G2]